MAAGHIQVAVQIPYVMSAGFPGVGLGIVGIGLIVIGVRETDAQVRRRQQQELLALMTVLRDELTAQEPEPAPAAPVRRTRKSTR